MGNEFSAGDARVELWSGKLRNFVHSAVLIGGMILLLCAIGLLIAGPRGLVLLGISGGVLLVLTRGLSSQVILRMYRAQPLTERDAPGLVRLVHALARKADLPEIPTVYYVPSRMINAFAVGSRRRAAIGVTDGLLRALDARELVGVLAHEVSHVRANDLWVMGLADLISRATNTLSFLGQFLLLLNLPLLLMGQAVVPWGAVVLLILAPTLSALLQLALSRTREYDADLGAVQLTGDPRGLASALHKLEHLNAGFIERVLLPGRRVPEPSLLRTHPRTEDRIRRLLAFEREYGPIERRVRPLESAMYGPGSRATMRVPCWHISGLWY